MRTVTLIIVGLGATVDHVFEANDTAFEIGMLSNTGIDNADGGTLTGEALLVKLVNAQGHISGVH